MATNAQLKLKQGLILLLDQYEFDQISISKICKEAGVHRSTFYTYYDNQFDLLEDAQSYLTELFLTEFKEQQQKLNAPKEWGSLMDSYYLVPYLNYIKRHQKLYKIFLKNPIDFNHEQHVEGTIAKHFLRRYREHGIRDEKKIRYMSHFYITGIRAIIYDWVMAGCEDDIDYIIEIIHTIIF